MRVVSLFSGAGGLDLGFKMAGHDVIWANDLYEDAVHTYQKNLGKHIVLEDIHNISAEDIPDCDIVIGGFPCQGFSVGVEKSLGLLPGLCALCAQVINLTHWLYPP